MKCHSKTKGITMGQPPEMTISDLIIWLKLGTCEVKWQQIFELLGKKFFCKIKIDSILRLPNIGIIS